jgi:spermidine synthase
MTRGAILAIFFLTGASGLIFEVLWMRMLGLVFGSAAHAVSAVLASFMAGLALGAAVFGRVADRLVANRADGRRVLLRLFAGLEACAALYALATPLLFGGVSSLEAWLFQRVGVAPGLEAVFVFAFCFLVLLVPTALMGGSLPVLTKAVVLGDESAGAIGRRAALLYGVNTLGAVAGCAAAGFFLIPALGLRTTLLCGAGIALGCAVVVWARSGSCPAESGLEAAEPVSAEGRKGFFRARAALFGAIGLSGFAALGCEVVWTRVLSLMIGPSVYGFTVMLSIFLSGLGLGGLVFARAFPVREGAYDADRDWRLFGLFQAAIAAASLLVVPFVGGSLSFVEAVLARFGGTFGGFQASSAVLCGIVMLLPTVLFGACLPLACRIEAGGRDGGERAAGTAVGGVYAANTAGAVIGAVAAGFLLLPIFGLRGTMIVLALVNACLSGALLFRGLSAVGDGRRWAAAIPALGLLVAVLAPSWDAAALSGGIYFRRPGGFHGSGSGVGPRDRVLYYAEGPVATVMVRELEGNRSVTIDGRIVASAGRFDRRLQKMMGHLPMLLSERTENALVIGVGAGMSLGALARHPVRAIDAVELEPRVYEAARYFEDENGSVLKDPRVVKRVGDGRRWLRRTGKRYDVISADPIHPYYAGSGSLFSREYFQLCRSRLEPGGIMAQWVPLYWLALDDLRMVLRTFAGAFEHSSVWFTGGDLILVGSPSPIRFDRPELARRMALEPVKRDLAELDIESPEDLLGLYVNSGTKAVARAENSPLITDDLPFLEFSAPKGVMAAGTFNARLGELLSFWSGPDLEDWPGEGVELRSNSMRLTAKGLALAGEKKRLEAVEVLERAIASDPGNRDARYHLARVFLALSGEAQQKGRADEAFSYRKKAYEADPGLLPSERKPAQVQRGRDSFEESLKLLGITPGHKNAAR